MILLSSDDPGPRDPAAVEPSTCSSEGQDLTEPDIFGAQTAQVSTLHRRAEKVLKFCSTSASLVEKTQVFS